MKSTLAIFFYLLAVSAVVATLITLYPLEFCVVLLAGVVLGTLWIAAMGISK